MKHLSRTQDDMEWVGMVWYDGLVRMGWDGMGSYLMKGKWVGNVEHQGQPAVFYFVRLECRPRRGQKLG